MTERASSAEPWLGRAACLVGGEWRIPDGPALPVIDPYTEQPIGETAEAGPVLTAEAVSRAAAAYPAWERTSPADRADLLDRLADSLEARAGELAALITREMGMPAALATASQGELPPRVLRAFATSARAFAWTEKIDGAQLHRIPLGVVAAITPWNMPAHQIIAKVGAALAAGNTVVLKPSEATPFDANLIAAAALEAGFPPGVLNVVHGTGPATGQALVTDPRVGHVSFTGSVPAGQTVAALAAGHTASTTLELGGKSAAVLLPDADLAHAVGAAVKSGLVNSGQACNATTRIVVPRSALADVGDLVLDALDTVVAGDPRDPATTFGPLASARQRDRVRHLLDTAGDDRAVTPRLALLPARGYFLEPRVYFGLDARHPLVRQEVFGPVLVVQSYADETDATDVANDSDFGLSAEVWSADPDRAEAFARTLRVGQVKINGVRTRERPGVPFGGFKASGYGRELGAEGIAALTAVQAVLR
ncbi:aldehyde dehydrogenase family protein [Amycolatopsis sp. NPDC051903]|uniref:aldehyde dehydrogenase family protein n=1 Tax=Amycolatopsis sp. NPDC051903 TaxID=3363936 RepID=UPI0037B36A2D